MTTVGTGVIETSSTVLSEQAFTRSSMSSGSTLSTKTHLVSSFTRPAQAQIRDAEEESLSTGGKVALGVCIPLFVLLLAGAVFWTLRR